MASRLLIMKTLSARHILVGAVSGVFGLLLVIIGTTIELGSLISLSSLIANFGAFIALIASINLVYELFTRRDFMHEVRVAVTGSASVAQAGIIGFTDNSTNFDFSKYIQKSKNITLVFNFNTRFINDYSNLLGQFLNSGGCVEFVCLASEGVAVNSMVELGYAKENVTANFKKIEQLKNRHNGQNFKFVHVDANLKYACVIFDADAFVILSTSSPGRSNVPMIHIEKGGELWDFIVSDVQNLKRNSSEK